MNRRRVVITGLGAVTPVGKNVPDMWKAIRECKSGIAPITLFIGALVWYHRISARIGTELQRRGIAYSFGAGSFWGWGVLGALIVVGPFIYWHKLLTSMNLLSESYNRIG